ncbi:MAG: hypothetical protein MHM6MM_005891 [Cercozoa sp. M6MM]
MSVVEHGEAGALRAENARLRAELARLQISHQQGGHSTSVGSARKAKRVSLPRARHTRARSISNAVLGGTGLVPRAKEHTLLDSFLEAIRRIAHETTPERTAAAVVDETCALLQCDRATLFFVDEDAQELVLLIATGAREIRLPMGQGVAGSVAVHGRTVNIADAYADARFDPSHDKQSGYRTRSLLCAPIFDYDGDIVAVLQAINKKDGTGNGTAAFGEQDETLLDGLASHVGVALRNVVLSLILLPSPLTLTMRQTQTMYELDASRRQVSALLNVVRMLHSKAPTHSLLFELNQRASQLVCADRCTLYIADHAREELVLLDSDLNFDLRFPMAKGIAGHVAVTNTGVNIRDVYDDERFNPEYDKRSGYRTRSMLCMPLRNSQNECIGVMQCINKTTEDCFSVQDEELLDTLLAIAGSIIENSRLFDMQPRKMTEVERAGDLQPVTPRRRQPLDLDIAAIAEEPEDFSDADYY